LRPTGWKKVAAGERGTGESHASHATTLTNRWQRIQHFTISVAWLPRERTQLNVENVATACPVSGKDCVTCHMPKYDIPGMHYKFTDHWIRVAKAGEPYPD
jgi:hypothetical protein